jgi:uncharacterized protein (DUF362 family)
MDLTAHRVFLEKCSQYEQGLLAECIGRITEPLLANRNFSSARVLIKPNLISATHGSLPCTEGDFILTVTRLFLDHGAHVRVGDSPAFGSAASVLGRLGIRDSLKKLSVPVANFTRVRQVTLPSGIRTGLAADALDCDLLVNLPKVKAHVQLRITLAVKNYFGCLAGMRKPLWHMMYGGRQGDFARYVVELLSILPDSLTIVDGIRTMHETGPVRGRAFDLGLIAGSFNPVAIDRTFLDIVGINPAASPLMAACKRACITGTDMSELEFPLHAPQDVRVNDFEVPGELNPIRFNPFRFMKNSFRRLFRH